MCIYLTRGFKIHKAKLTELKGGIDEPTIRVGDLNTLYLVINRTSGINISKN